MGGLDSAVVGHPSVKTRASRRIFCRMSALHTAARMVCIQFGLTLPLALPKMKTIRWDRLRIAVCIVFVSCLISGK